MSSSTERHDRPSHADVRLAQAAHCCSSGSGSTGSPPSYQPPTQISKCRWGPLELPVLPTCASGCPAAHPLARRHQDRAPAEVHEDVVAILAVAVEHEVPARAAASGSARTRRARPRAPRRVCPRPRRCPGPGGGGPCGARRSARRRRRGRSGPLTGKRWVDSPAGASGSEEGGGSRPRLRRGRPLPLRGRPAPRRFAPGGRALADRRAAARGGDAVRGRRDRSTAGAARGARRRRRKGERRDAGEEGEAKAHRDHRIGMLRPPFRSGKEFLLAATDPASRLVRPRPCARASRSRRAC